MSIINQIQITAVFADVENNIPSFAYTNGLYEQNMPEIITFGLPPDSAHYAINRTIAVMKEKGGLPYFGLPIQGILPDYDLTFLQCDSESVKSYMMGCSNINEKDCVIIQLCWPDSNNVFSWESGFDENFRDQQILIGRFD